MKVMLAGEGPDELGKWSHEREYRDDSDEVGVIESLLRRIHPSGWQVVDAVVWKRIRKFRAGDHASAEARNVLGAVLTAVESGCDALVFMRDRDNDEERERDVEDGIARAARTFPDCQLVGGIAAQELEAWILALKGERGAERLRDAKKALGDRHRIESRDAMLEVVENADLARVPDDAASLKTWIERARKLPIGAAE